MSNGDRTKMERVEYTNDEQHVYINGKQWVSLERFTQIRNEINAEIMLLGVKVKRLTEENEAYKVLLRDKLNQED